MYFVVNVFLGLLSSIQTYCFEYYLFDDKYALNPGKYYAIVGKSGGGKSTIINLLLRFYDPKAGEILVNGKDLKTLNPISYRSHIGVVSQVS